MKKYTPIGARIKSIREQLDKGSTQKELSYKVGISERILRKIENANHPIPATVLDALASALGVHRRELVYSFDTPQLVAENNSASGERLAQSLGWNKDRVVPRFDEDLAKVTMDEGELLSEASHSHDVEGVIKVTLNSETGEYAAELMGILTGLSWEQRSPLNKMSVTEELDLRKRIRQLLVLLKGNDVWVYETKIFRTLPESDVLQPDDAPSSLHSRLYVVFGPPGEWGDETINVMVDNGQPFILKAFLKA